MRDDFSKTPCLCGFQGIQVRDESFFKNLFINSNRLFCSSYVYKVFGLCLQGVRIGLTKCSTESLGGIPFGGTLCSQRGNGSFPTWEQLISKLGTK